MPTIFTNCDQCYYLDYFTLDHPHNKLYKRDLEKQYFLMSMGIPKEVSQFIIRMSNDTQECSFCVGNKMKLCYQHRIHAEKCGKEYRGYGLMCPSCCWFEIT